MDVKGTKNQKHSKIIIAESLVKDYFDLSDNSSPVLKYLDESSNLLNLQEKHEDGVLKSLNKRMSMGFPYTSIGKDLIAINCDLPGSWYFNKELKSNNLKSKPHPYSISLNSYIKLKETHQNQVITMLGPCGAGKTFNAIHVLDHLIKISTEEHLVEEDICLNLFENFHKCIQVLHIMASVCKSKNLESTTCALDINLHFDSAFRCTGGSLSASLLDITLPVHKGRTFQILHSLLYCDPNTLKILGIKPNAPFKIFEGTETDIDFEIFDMEVNQRFFECLGFLDITLSEKKSFLETLTSVINLHELEFLRKQNPEVKNKIVLRKICKSLGLSEGVFIEKFLSCPKDEPELRCKDFARFLYVKAFEWLENKVNQKLNRVSEHIIQQRKMYFSRGSRDRLTDEEFTTKYSINILDFPGFNKEKSLSGLIKNLAYESLNYYCSSNYMKLCEQLDKEKIEMKGLEESHSKKVVHFFMQDNIVLSSLFASEKEFKSTWQKIKTEKSKIVSFCSEDSFNVSFTHSSVNYDLLALRKQASQVFFNDFNMSLLKSCSAEIISKKQKPLAKIDEVFAKPLKKVLYPYLNINPFVIHCLKTDAKGINRKTLDFLRKSSVFPNLIWKWYGFPHWLRLEDVAKELNLKQSSAGQVVAELKKRFKWDSVQTSENFVLLKTSQMNDFKAYINKQCKQPENVLSDISMSLSLFSLSAEQDFMLTVHEDSSKETQATRPTVVSHEFSYIDIQQVYDEFDSLTQATISKKSLNGSYDDSIIILKPNKGPKNGEFKKFDYSDNEDKVLMIQKVWRGHTDRQYVRELRKIHLKASLIQAAWKGYLVRKNFGPVLVYQHSAFVIQKYWKLYLIRRNIAARKIFRWYKKIKNRKMSSKSNPRSKKIIEDSVKKQNNKLQKKINKKLRSSKSPKILEGTKKSLSMLRDRSFDGDFLSENNEKSKRKGDKNSSFNGNQKDYLGSEKHEKVENKTGKNSPNFDIKKEDLFSGKSENKISKNSSSFASEKEDLLSGKFENKTGKNSSSFGNKKEKIEKTNSSNSFEKEKEKITQNYFNDSLGKKSKIGQNEEFSGLTSFNSKTKSFKSYDNQKSTSISASNLKSRDSINSANSGPKLSKNSEILAQKKFSQFSELSFIERFKILEANRVEKIHKLRQEKLESETYSYLPTVNKNDMIKNTFEQRQETFLKNAKIKLEQVNKFVEKEEFSFKPIINSSARSRSPNQTVEELYNWAKRKDKKINQARDAKAEAEIEEGFKLGNSSFFYSMIRKRKEDEGQEISERIKRDNSPYWPRNS